jgi:glycogen operon protein
LRDLVSYNDKHNQANGEDNNDGESHNRSWNHGVEGPTSDPGVLALRAKQQRNFLTTLLLSQGVPMLLHGDEGGRTQDGNNNTYAQDAPISWLHWDDLDEPLVEFTATVARLRREHPTFRRRRFFTGTDVRTGPDDDDRLNDIVWLHLGGAPMGEGDWNAPDAKSLGMFLNGRGIAGADARGEVVVDDNFLLYFNAGAEDAPLTLPPEEYAEAWDVVIDTGEVRRRKGPIKAGVRSKVAPRSVLVLREHTAPTAAPETSAAASVAAQGQNNRAKRTG